MPTCLSSFAQFDDPISQHVAAWSCTLAADAIDDCQPAIGLASRAIAKDANDQQYRVGLGAILLRSGNAMEAKVEFEQALALAGNKKTSPAYAEYLLAITEATLGNIDASEEHLRLANETSARELTGAVAWNRKLTLELLRNEAESLLTTKSQPAANEADEPADRITNASQNSQPVSQPEPSVALETE